MPRMTAMARAFRNGVLFVASVMPQLMSDFGKRLVRLETTWGESRTQFIGASRYFDG